VYIDGRQIAHGEVLEADVCIVGGGPAGITIALELLDSPSSVILVESGGWRPNKLTQGLNHGELAPASRHPPPEMYRERRFGGSSAIWGGRCVPLTRSDFEPRNGVTNSGWPLRYDDLIPYYSKAMSYCEAGEFAFDNAEAHRPIIDGLDSRQIAVGLERFSPPTDFGRRYKSRLTRSQSHKIVLESTCVGLQSDGSGRHVETVACTTISGNTFSIRARYIVLAAGGLESVRLLAASVATFPAGLANSSGLLGRYYMCHLEGTLGELQVAPGRPVTWGFVKTTDGVYAKHHLRLSDETQRRHQLRNMIFRLHHANPVDPGHGDPVLSLMFVAKRFILPEYRRKIATVELDALKELPKGSRLLARHAANIARSPLRLIGFLSSWAIQRHARYRRVPYVALYSKRGTYPVDYNAEQTPLHDSRILLTGDRDRFGIPKLRIDWRVSPDDIDSIAASYRHLQHILASTEVATLNMNGSTLDQDARRAIAVGGHHIGTARMSSDPRQGVVNPQCRTHDIDNVYVAGSAVFPTSGSANPTLTIVALALRIADQLKHSLRRFP
jgi:choline dehydrogenase-like flavoprotein